MEKGRWLVQMRLIDADDFISRFDHVPLVQEAIKKAMDCMPTIQSEIIRCKDCRWWDKYGDYDNGYCMAAKHGYLSGHWEISIRRTYKGDFYCADAERRADETD